MGVVTLTGCVPLIIRKLFSRTAFHQLNCEEEKTQSFLEQRDGTKYTSWKEGASVWLNVRDKGKGLLTSGRRGNEWIGGNPLKFQKFLTLPMDGNYSSTYKETSTIAIKHSPRLTLKSRRWWWKGRVKTLPSQKFSIICRPIYSNPLNSRVTPGSSRRVQH